MHQTEVGVGGAGPAALTAQQLSCIYSKHTHTHSHTTTKKNKLDLEKYF